MRTIFIFEAKRGVDYYLSKISVDRIIGKGIMNVNLFIELLCIVFDLVIGLLVT